jgi:hypothetical protein
MPRNSAISTRLTFDTGASRPSACQTKASAAAKSGAAGSAGAARSRASAIRRSNSTTSGVLDAEDEAEEAARRIWSALGIFVLGLRSVRLLIAAKLAGPWRELISQGRWL